MRIGFQKLFARYFFALFLCACASVPSYDPATEQSIAQLQRQFEFVFAPLEYGVGSPAADYRNYATDYQKLEVELGSLLALQEARPNNSTIVDQLTLLEDSLIKFSEVHQGGLSDPTAVRAWRSAYNTTFAMMLRSEASKRDTI